MQPEVECRIDLNTLAAMTRRGRAPVEDGGAVPQHCKAHNVPLLHPQVVPTAVAATRLCPLQTFSWGDRCQANCLATCGIERSAAAGTCMTLDNMHPDFYFLQFDSCDGQSMRWALCVCVYVCVSIVQAVPSPMWQKWRKTDLLKVVLAAAETPVAPLPFLCAISRLPGLPPVPPDLWIAAWPVLFPVHGPPTVAGQPKEQETTFQSGEVQDEQQEAK